MFVQNLQNLLWQKKTFKACLLKRQGVEMPSRHVTSRQAVLWFGACGQEHFLPTNAAAVELMRNCFLKPVKLRVHVVLR